MVDLLNGLRVLDLSDERGEVASWLLGHLGAEVVKAEPVGGCPSRSEPFRFEAYNAGKSSIVIDDEGTLRDLIGWSEIIIDAGPPGRLAALGEPTELLAAGQVYVLVTPFGPDGPRAGQPASELTLAALGGPVRLQGVRDRAPVHVSVPQVWRHAGAEAAVAALVARQTASTADGPIVVDLSAQSVMTWTMLNAMEAAQVQGFDFERAGATVELAMSVSLRRPAADGHVILVAASRSVVPLLPVLQADGVIDERWLSEDWGTWEARIIDGLPVQLTVEEVRETLDQWSSKRTKSELLELGQELGVTIAPINTVADLSAFGQLDARNFWASNPSGSRRPGGFITVNGERQRPYGSGGEGERPPLSEPDNDRAAVLASMAARADRREDSTTAGVPAGRRERESTDLPFAGLKVADFSWIGVGPITAKCLADHGATVVRVESANRIDGLRVQPPFKDAEHGVNRSNFYGTFNTSKWSIAADLKTPEGLEVARGLVEWADVVVDSFTPGTMQRLGVGPEDIRAINPSAITVTTSLLGSGGPYSSMAGYGYHAAAIAGFFELVGYPDGEPDGPWLAYTDTIGPRFITPTLLAALERRERTGEGCHIEAAQLEIALQLLAPELAEYLDAGIVAGRRGNRDRHIAPQGVYPCRGGDQWVALSVADDEAWSRLASLIGHPEAAEADVEQRHIDHDQIDEWIGAWALTLTEAEAEAALKAIGIAAGAVQRSSDLAVDPQYQHRGFFRHLDHIECGPVPYAGHQYQIAPYPTPADGASLSGNGPRFAAPALGQHSFEVLTDLLGWDSERIALIAAAGALE